MKARYSGKDIGDAVRAFGEAYRLERGDRMPASHRQAFDDIAACRTEAMGGHRRCKNKEW